MPTVTAWIDELREAFGKADIDAAIRKGLKTDCPADERFFASENGHTVGKRAVYPPGSRMVTPVVVRPVVVGRAKA